MKVMEIERMQCGNQWGKKKKKMTLFPQPFSLGSQSMNPNRSYNQAGSLNAVMSHRVLQHLPGRADHLLHF